MYYEPFQYNLYLKTPPTIEPVSLSEMKQTLGMAGIDDDCTTYIVDDDYISALIIAAREYCESYKSEAFLTQTFEMTFQDFPCKIDLPRRNIQSVVSVKYKNYLGVTTTLVDGTDYLVSKRGVQPYIVPTYGKTFPSFTPYPVDAITVEFVAGYDSPAEIPERTKQAIKLLATHWYENRTPIDATRTEPKEIAFMLTALLNIDRRRKI